MSKIKIGIALGGGGALGMAHIGVLKALIENDIKPEIVVGTSIGALIGGVYSTGMPVNVMEEEAIKVKTSHLLDVNLKPSGLLSGKSAIKVVRNVIKSDYYIEDMPIKFGATAVDIESGEEVLLTTGSVLDAIRASISVPGVFIPCEINNQLLVDGGTLNNLPEDHVKNMGADVVLSVNLLSDFVPYTKPKTMVHSVAFSFFIMQKKLVETKKCYADLRINLPLKDYRQYIFSEEVSKELIDIGYTQTLKEIPKIKKLIKKFENKIK